MLVSTLLAFSDYWNLYHKVTFDGPNKLIWINPETTTIDVSTDLYSDWKEWFLLEDNSKFLQAFSTTGGDPLPGSKKVGQYFFLNNGWKLVYPSDSLASEINIDGNLFADDGSNVFHTGSLTNIRLVRQVVSQYTEIASPNIQVTVSGSGLTPQETAVLNGSYVASTAATQSLNQQSVVLGAITASANMVLVSQSIQSSQLSGIEASQFTQSLQMNNIESSSATVIISQSIHSLQLDSIAGQVNGLGGDISGVAGQVSGVSDATNTIITSQSILSLQIGAISSGSLTPEQSTMLLEMYRLLGLDPTKPLVVGNTYRRAGSEISQSIASGSGAVTVTRL